MISTTITVRREGGRFVALIPSVRREVITDLDKTAQETVRRAKMYVPKKTYMLHDSLDYNVDANSLTAWVYADPTLNGSDRDYAGYVEWGTSIAPAQPYMTPAIEETRGFFQARMRDALARGIVP